MFTITSFGGEFAFLKVGQYFKIAGAALKPLGLGSSGGRTVASNLVEQMAMEDAMANPTNGVRIMEGMKDPHWLGWTKNGI